VKTSRDLSGRKPADMPSRYWDYSEVHQIGSHIILQAETQRFAVPAHKVLRIGTFNAIVRLVANHKGAPREAILQSILR